MANPFSPTASDAGTGTIHLALLPPDTPRLKTLNYRYPLKLISPAPLRTEGHPRHLVYTVYLLTYGGGLVAGDAVDLSITVERTTRLVLLTQGSTKLFKSPSRDIMSRQRTSVELGSGSAICYLPDPVQPFESSAFEQQQIYTITQPLDNSVSCGSLCVLDWASNGRPANGENWSFYRYCSKNEIYARDSSGCRTLLLRDNILLDDALIESSVAARMDGLAVYGTLMLYGSLYHDLGQFFIDEFKALPRIGARKWDSGSESGDDGDIDPAAVRRLERQRQETSHGFLWSAAALRGCVVVKFGAHEVEHGRQWLRTMLLEEGTIVHEFGERALLCLR